MIAYGLLVTFATWAVLLCIGEAAARCLFGDRALRVAFATRLPLGVAVTVCLLESAGYFLPIRTAAWFLLLPAAFGFFRLARAGSEFRVKNRAVFLASFVGLAVGLVPIAIAHRFTASALTNNDGTYYVTTADWLGSVAWRSSAPSWDAVPPSRCLLEWVLHEWHWRTGTPNLMAAVSALSGVSSTEALAVVTAILFACVPGAAIGVSRSVGIERGTASELVVGVVPALAASAAFLGFQHMTGHLAAQSLFLAVSGALLAAVRRGGVRRIVHAGILVAASVAFFADGAPALVVVGVAALVAGGAGFARSLGRAASVAVASAVASPSTAYRAAYAAFNTYRFRVPTSRAVFPQRGWLPRGILDDLATLVGVDPWPPWPAAWPPTVVTAATWLGALAAVALLGKGFGSFRSGTGERRFATVLGAFVLAGAALARVDYLRGKVLLSAAALVVPLVAVGVAELSRRRGRSSVVVLPYVLAELVALAVLGDPSRWKVVDRPAHDRLVPELSRLPAGSLVAFDGLGAPSDSVLDTQRAYRAALLADLRPIQPGLDGGFYVPSCPDVRRPDPLPGRAYALQRTTSETLTRGAVLADFPPFRLLEVDLGKPASFVAAWAPTHGWLPVEREPGGRIFRWAEWQAKGTLHVVARAPCARLRGQMRVVRGTVRVDLRAGADSIHVGTVSPEWTDFETSSFAAESAVEIALETSQATSEPPDAAHGLALSRLEVEPVLRCGEVLVRGGAGPATFPLEFDEAMELVVRPAGASECSRISVLVEGERLASISLSLDGSPPSWRLMNASTTTVESTLLRGSADRNLVLTAKGGTPGRRFRVIDVVTNPRACSEK